MQKEKYCRGTHQQKKSFCFVQMMSLFFSLPLCLSPPSLSLYLTYLLTLIDGLFLMTKHFHDKRSEKEEKNVTTLQKYCGTIIQGQWEQTLKQDKRENNIMRDICVCYLIKRLKCCAALNIFKELTTLKCSSEFREIMQIFTFKFGKDLKRHFSQNISLNYLLK